MSDDSVANHRHYNLSLKFIAKKVWLWPLAVALRLVSFVIDLSRPVRFALYGRSNRKSVGSPKAVPLRSANPTSGIAGGTRLIWAIESYIGRIAGGRAVKIGASHERHRQYFNDYGIFTITANQLRHTNTGDGGARRRAGAPLSRGRARPSSGAIRCPRPQQAPEHVLDQAQKAMEVTGRTTNAGALQESCKRSARSYCIAASFPADCAMLRCVGQPVRALGFA
eukprot:6179835-Pleurochrysis_carterae.AAC.10